MLYASLIALIGMGILSVSCKPREYNSAETKSSVSQGSAGEVNAMAFNALKIWNGEVLPDGSPAKEILEYPTHPLSYNSYQGKPDADEVFYSAGSEYVPAVITPASVTGVGSAEMGYPNIQLTEGLQVEKDREDEILVYPANKKSGKSLRLRFTKEDSQVTNQEAAVKYCASRNMRLPTSREVFDFCTADILGQLKGKYYAAQYPETGRCAKRFVLSATVNIYRLTHSFRFEGWNGLMKTATRSPSAVHDPGTVTRCVGRR
jgi:hypothetical protein